MYDSSLDTIKHIERVAELMHQMIDQLVIRAMVHDATKLQEPEKSAFDRVSVKLKNVTYGTPEYKESLLELGEALQHHYKNNSHHPQHYANSFDGMSLLDIMEMFCDWKAAGERHGDGSLERSLEVNKTRFGISDQLWNILDNTRKELEW